MVKKTKEVEVNLYNFNAHEEDEKKKNKKRTKKSKKQVKKNNVKKENIQDTKFSFDNEIVIGLPKKEETKNSDQNSKKKKVPKKSNKKKANKNKVNKKKNTKIQKPISKKEQEIRKQKRIKKFKIAKYVALVICILAIIIGTMASPLFNVKEIIVQGNEKITKDEIINLSEITLDENTYKINKSKSEKKILEKPYIKTVEIKRELPSKIVITVEERIATYMIEYGNAYVYINNQGYILEVSSQKLEVPIIQGAETNAEELVPGNRLCNNDLEKMSTVIKIMELAASNEIANLITRIDIENSKNYKIVFESEQKVAYLGDETDLNTKILSIKSILEKEKNVAGKIFVNMDLKKNYPTFRQSV